MVRHKASQSSTFPFPLTDRPMRSSLRRQIMLPLLAVAVAGLAAVAAINAQLASNGTRQRIERQLAGVTTVLATSNFPLTDSVLWQMRGLSGAEFVVSNETGATLSASFDKRPASLPQEPQAERETPGLGTRILIDGESYFHRVTALPARGTASQARVLHVLFPEAEVRSAWRAAFLPPIVVGAITLLGVAAITSVVARRLARAAARLSDEMLRIASGDFTTAELPTTDDEIRGLSLAVNRTAEMLALYDQQVRQSEQMRTAAMLGAGIAHEMRNAATGCRIAIDLHAEQCGGDGESLTVAKRQLLLMESRLHRFMHAGKPATRLLEREVELSALVEELLPLVRPVARHAGVELRWNPTTDAPRVLGDDAALGEAIVNLLLNAIEAVQQSKLGAPRIVTAEIRTSRPGFAELLVSDNGPGPEGDVADELFAPFTTSKPEGVGLGLAVAKRIVEEHRGTIDWLRLEGITRFRVEMPQITKGVSCV